jgi:hypothetical protein
MSGPAPDLAESLAWLDYCLEEAEAAMGAVKAAAEFIRTGTIAPERINFHAVCLRAAQLTTFRMLCSRIGKREKYS